jgi:hypothetical protein
MDRVCYARQKSGRQPFSAGVAGPLGTVCTRAKKFAHADPLPIDLLFKVVSQIRFRVQIGRGSGRATSEAGFLCSISSSEVRSGIQYRYDDGSQAAIDADTVRKIGTPRGLIGEVPNGGCFVFPY